MNLRDYLWLSPDVGDAITAHKPVVALPAKSASDLQLTTIRNNGATPAPIAVIDGVLCVGVKKQTLPQTLDTISRSNLPFYLAEKKSGMADLCTCMIICALAGISVLMCEKINGVCAQDFMISADMHELRKSSVLVVCNTLDMQANAPMTVQYLENVGVPVIGLRTNTFSQKSLLNQLVETEAQIAKIAKTKWNLGLQGGLLVSPDANIAACAGRIAASL